MSKPIQFNIFGRLSLSKLPQEKAKRFYLIVVRNVQRNSDQPKDLLRKYVKATAKEILGADAPKTDSTYWRWVNDILGADGGWIDQRVDWTSAKAFNTLGVSAGNQSRILQSTRWLDKWAENGSRNEESYRYVKWADMLLRLMGSDADLDMDLWVISKVLEERDALGEDNQDLIDWIKYAPYRSDDKEKDYLDAIKNKSVQELRFAKIGDTELGHKTKNKFGEWQLDAKSDFRYLAKGLLAQMLFWYDIMFKAEIVTSGSPLGLGVDRLPLKPYYLPSNKLACVLSLTKESGSIGITDLEDKDIFDIPIEDCVKNNNIALKSASKPSNTHSFVAKDINVQYLYSPFQMPSTLTA